MTEPDPQGGRSYLLVLLEFRLKVFLLKYFRLYISVALNSLNVAKTFQLKMQNFEKVKKSYS